MKSATYVAYRQETYLKFLHFYCRSSPDRTLIVELKKGGFKITQAEIDQAKNYAIELKRSSAVGLKTSIECFVLGSTQEPFASPLEITDQQIKVTPRTYDSVLRQANARIFNLKQGLLQSEWVTFLQPV